MSCREHKNGRWLIIQANTQRTDVTIIFGSLYFVIPNNMVGCPGFCDGLGAFCVHQLRDNTVSPDIT